MIWIRNASIDWTKEYIDKTLDLVKKGLSTDITLCITGSKNNVRQKKTK